MLEEKYFNIFQLNAYSQNQSGSWNYCISSNIHVSPNFQMRILWHDAWKLEYFIVRQCLGKQVPAEMNNVRSNRRNRF
jgi:hypothetical protein